MFKVKVLKALGTISGFAAMHLVCCGGLLFSSTLLGVGAGTALLSTNILVFAAGAAILAVGAAFWHHSKCKKQCGCPGDKKRSFMPIKKMGLKVVTYALSGIVLSLAFSQITGFNHSTYHDHTRKNVTIEKVQSEMTGHGDAEMAHLEHLEHN